MGSMVVPAGPNERPAEQRRGGKRDGERQTRGEAQLLRRQPVQQGEESSRSDSAPPTAPLSSLRGLTVCVCV